VVLLFTAATGWCALYKLFGISTAKYPSETAAAVAGRPLPRCPPQSTSRQRAYACLPTCLHGSGLSPHFACTWA
jgi:hypothetical protein